jgi:hypothetical protein
VDFRFGDKLLQWLQSCLHEEDDVGSDGRLLGQSWATQGTEKEVRPTRLLVLGRAREKKERGEVGRFRRRARFWPVRL